MSWTELMYEDGKVLSRDAFVRDGIEYCPTVSHFDYLETRLIRTLVRCRVADRCSPEQPFGARS